ncbi:MAG TPA: TetR/AcrR family transcriptional regulator [Terracidiphilus sp.]|jgi:AcrR family transcriptional regulator
MANTELAKRAGRPRGFDEDQALDCAMHVFWRKGFEGASLNDLTTAMGIQPASLYMAFGNKRTLFEKALARYLAGPVAFMHDALTEPTAFAVADRILRRTAEFLTEGRSRCGCMTIQAALAGGVEGAPIRRMLIALRVKEQDALCRRFERAKSEGDLPSHADAADLARFVTAIYQGMTVQAINGASREDLLRLSDTALRIWPK